MKNNYQQKAGANLKNVYFELFNEKYLLTKNWLKLEKIILRVIQ